MTTHWVCLTMRLEAKETKFLSIITNKNILFAPKFPEERLLALRKKMEKHFVGREWVQDGDS